MKILFYPFTVSINMSEARVVALFMIHMLEYMLQMK